MDEILPDLDAALAQQRAAVLIAPPGAGKTTRVPLHLLEARWLDGHTIVMLEPRRLAARAAAQRMSDLIGDSVGGVIGYQTRDERRIGPETRIQVVTEGVLTRRLQHDQELPGVGLVIFDEVHERNLPTDLGLALALDVRRTIRPDLVLLAMSATAEADRLAVVLGVGGYPAPVVSSEGREHPVEVRWAPVAKGQRLDAAVVEAVLLSVRNDDGDILVFLPGIGEITRVQNMLRGRIAADVDVHALAGALSLADQDRALAPSPPGRRRVVLSTDIAETSLTVPGVRIVIDAGQARVPRYDTRTGMTRLTTIPTSRASADQRAGRAGRTEPGVAYRLWGKLEHTTRRAHLDPEITQVDLAGLALELAAWGSSSLDFLDAPPPCTLAQGVDLLRMLGALDDHGAIAPAGRRMLTIPAHPRLARMVVDAPVRDRALASIVAALLDDRDVLRGRMDELPADLALRIEVIAGAATHPNADRAAVDRVLRRARDISARSGGEFDIDTVDPHRAGVVLALAYPDRLAVRRSQPGQFQLRGGTGAWLSATDPLAREKFLVAADVDGDRKNARIRLAAPVDADDLAAALGDAIEVRTSLVWDKDRGDLVERIERRLGNLKIDERSQRPAPGAATTTALVDRVRATRLAALRWSSAAAQLRARVRFIGEPDWSDRALVATLDDWLAPYLAGMTSITEVESLDLNVVLRAGLAWEVVAHLDTVAPIAIELPSGRTLRIDYSDGRPSAAARVQDLFGVKTHPMAGDVPVVLHLLSPADRPLQITADLPGFWAGSWADVRKEMAGRYPKHHWPADPAG